MSATSFRPVAFPILMAGFALTSVSCQQDVCHDDDPSTCCCRNSWGQCRDPSNGNLPEPGVTCEDNAQVRGNSGSGPAYTPPAPVLPTLPTPELSGGSSWGGDWTWEIELGAIDGVKLCYTLDGSDPTSASTCVTSSMGYGNGDGPMHHVAKITTGPRSWIRFRTFKDGWNPSPIVDERNPF